MDSNLTGALLLHVIFPERDEDRTATFCSLMQVLRDFSIPSTSKDVLWKRWETAKRHNRERHMRSKKFSDWLSEMQLKLIDKKGKQSISGKVKRRKFLYHLQQYMEGTLIPQIREDWTDEYLV